MVVSMLVWCGVVLVSWMLVCQHVGAVDAGIMTWWYVGMSACWCGGCRYNDMVVSMLVWCGVVLGSWMLVCQHVGCGGCWYNGLVDVPSVEAAFQASWL